MSAGGRSAFYTDKYGGGVEVRSCDCCVTVVVIVSEPQNQIGHRLERKLVSQARPFLFCSAERFHIPILKAIGAV